MIAYLSFSAFLFRISLHVFSFRWILKDSWNYHWKKSCWDFSSYCIYTTYLCVHLFILLNCLILRLLYSGFIIETWAKSYDFPYKCLTYSAKLTHEYFNHFYSHWVGSSIFLISFLLIYRRETVKMCQLSTVKHICLHNPRDMG